MVVWAGVSPPIQDENLLQSYNYHLPEELIAQHPASPRDSARLLVIDRARGEFEHRHFRDLPEYLGRDDLIVVNNTRVLKARLLGHRVLPGGGAGGKVEFVLLEERSPRVWEGLFHASAKYLPGLEFEIPSPDGRGLRGRLVRGSSESAHGTVVAEFDRDPVESGAGEVPLPKYIKRDRKTLVASETTPSDTKDEVDYQTAYAKYFGSAAAPTAGLHFTPELIQKLRAQGVGWEELTLHVGLGTFRPVKEENVSRHLMHEERYEVSAEAARHISESKRSGHRLVAVGTTSVRTLESAWGDGGLQAGVGRTSLFIRPGTYQFKAVDRLITNFHLPKSSLLMLVCAFAGRELVMRGYEEAVRERYRFFSYGDAMLIK